ncbi:hypothetical protein P8881_19635 [Bacillus haynesii]|nr:hypothetical protein [Bacillus haynesii]MEC0736882.1 hypothetical protein [Bacillus haynesii]
MDFEVVLKEARERGMFLTKEEEKVFERWFNGEISEEELMSQWLKLALLEKMKMEKLF